MKNVSCLDKLSILHISATLCGDRVRMSEDFVLNFCDIRIGCSITTPSHSTFNNRDFFYQKQHDSRPHRPIRLS
jgi:hypothetical protein